MHHVGIFTFVGAELWVVRTGLQLMWDLGFWNIMSEVDLEVVDHAFNKH